MKKEFKYVGAEFTSKEVAKLIGMKHKHLVEFIQLVSIQERANHGFEFPHTVFTKKNGTEYIGYLLSGAHCRVLVEYLDGHDVSLLYSALDEREEAILNAPTEYEDRHDGTMAILTLRNMIKSTEAYINRLETKLANI